MAALLLAQQYHKHGVKQKIIILEHRQDFRIEERQVKERAAGTAALTLTERRGVLIRSICDSLVRGVCRMLRVLKVASPTPSSAVSTWH
jgi:hypothetical protein